ncbi:MAG: hypothetical protein RLY31_3214 [Bacteroidota bacterium]
MGCTILTSSKVTVYSYAAVWLDSSICEGEVFLCYSATGTYTDVLSTAAGWDSCRLLALTVQPVDIVQFQSVACQRNPFPFLGNVCQESGTYVQVIPSAEGCDRTLVPELDYLPAISTCESAVIFAGESLLLHGEPPSQPGIYQYTLSNYPSCDRFVTLRLTFLPSQSEIVLRRVCQGRADP